MDTPFNMGSSVIVRPGEVYDEMKLDMSGWRGRVVGEDEDGDLLIAWDSLTLQEIPETAVAQWLADEADWTCMYIEPEALLPFDARDEIGDWLPIARSRCAAYGLPYDQINSNPLYQDLAEEEWDDDDDESLFPDDTPEYFDLDQFLYGLGIPVKEHPRIRRAFSQGLGRYYFDLYGHYKYGKQPADLIPDHLGVPYIFGYSVLAVLENARISLETKIKLCGYALETISPIAEDGVPYGIVTILGFLAQAGHLSAGLLLMGMMAVEYGGLGFFRAPIWGHGVTREGLLALLDWLAKDAVFNDEEKLWWVWRWSLRCENDPHLVKAMAHFWLERPDVLVEMKQELCWAWLNEASEVGTPPQTWQLMAAFMSGDREKLQGLTTELGILLPDLSLLDQMAFSAEDGEADLFTEMLYHLRSTWLIPAPLKRIAIPALARLGDDPLVVANMLWEGNHDYYTEAVHGGIADLLGEFQGQIDPAELRRLVEKGLGHGRVTVRKTYHLLARDLYGTEYLPQALQDSAKSLRTWAEKQMKKMG